MSHADRTLLAWREQDPWGELGTVRRYVYWSDRRVRDIAAANPIDLDRRWRTTFRTPQLGFLPQAELAEDRRTPQYYEIAGRVERAIGQLAVEDFVTPPPTAFALAQIEEERRASSNSPHEFIENRGQKPAPIYEDDESISVEILRTINNEGMIDSHVIQRIVSAEWFVDVYKDVELDKNRWNLKPGPDIPEPVDRIVIGTPLWIRSSSVSLGS